MSEKEKTVASLLLPIIYVSFISLGLPDSLLGSAWPSMQLDFEVPLSYAGAISMIIALGTIVSSLMSDRLTRKLGTGKVTAISVAMTAAALLSFSFAGRFWILCILAIPYGLGAGSVDAALNNYVALHYKSRHMSWLHAMWGIGAVTGPYIMGAVLTGGRSWNMGYRIIAVIQIFLTAILVMSLPLWKSGRSDGMEKGRTWKKALSLKEILKLGGAKEIMVCFFCYCAIEQTANLWAASYLTLYKGIAAESAAGYAAMFFIGITTGRMLSGFISMKLNDNEMIRLGEVIIAFGAILMALPGSNALSIVGLILIGLGCAPVYPCIIHSTPAHFGAENSQAIIGVQMASAYIGTCLMPPFFGLIANHISVSLMPYYIIALLALMAAMHEILVIKTRKR